MPVVPGLLERLAFRANLAPAAILDVHGAASLHAASLAAELDVFEALDRPRTADGLAADLDCDSAGMATLLDALVAVGYVDRDGDRYARSRGTDRWLVADGDADLAPFLRFWTEVVLPYWRDHARRAVRDGDPGESLYEWLGDDEAAWATAQAGFRSAASLLRAPVSDALGTVEGDRVLDLGGGHGAYAVALAERGADVTLVDHPAALAPAREAAAAAGVDLSLVGGDYLDDGLWDRVRGDEGAAGRDDGYDLVLLFNVLHGHKPAAAAALLDRATAALAPGGRVAVLDQFAADGPTKLAAVGVALIDLTYLVTLGGGTPDAAAVERWLASAGLSVTDSTTFRRAPGVRLLVATRA